jgi:hypothetical protein
MDHDDHLNAYGKKDSGPKPIEKFAKKPSSTDVAPKQNLNVKGG